MKQILATGKILSSHGVKGYVKVRPYSDDKKHFFKLKQVSVRTKSGKDFKLEVEDVKPFTDGLLIKFKDYDNPEDIRIFSGCDILIPRDQASNLKKGEIYTADLPGMKLIYDNEEAAEVVSVIDGAQSLLLEVKCPQDENTHLVPFMRGIYIDDVDVENGTIKLLNGDLLK